MEVGQLVLALYGSGDEWFAGKIRSKSGKNYDIEYLDGDEESGVVESSIRQAPVAGDKVRCPASVPRWNCRAGVRCLHDLSCCRGDGTMILAFFFHFLSLSFLPPSPHR